MVGGAIGAGVNQYVTNIGQRRTARANVVKTVSEVEAIFAKLRWPGSADRDEDNASKLHAELQECLYSLEGAGLIAGVPRDTVSAYILVCRMLDTAESNQAALDAADAAEEELKSQLASQAASGHAEAASIEALIHRIDESLNRSEPFREVIEDSKKTLTADHYSTLDMLSEALWHPVISKIPPRNRRQSQQTFEHVERMRRGLDQNAKDLLKQKNVMTKLASRLQAQGLLGAGQGADPPPGDGDASSVASRV